MIQETQRMHAEVERLHDMIAAQNGKITSLANEVASLKRAQVMASVAAQLAEKGHGGTA